MFTQYSFSYKKFYIFFIFLNITLQLLSPSENISQEKQLLVYFSIDNVDGKIINKGNIYKIILEFPYEVSLENLVATFRAEEGTLVFVKDQQQESGVTKNNFSVPVVYTLESKDNIIQKYVVDIKFKPEFKMNFDVNFHPAYDVTYQMLNLGINGNLMAGAKISRLIIGGKIFNEFYIFNGQYNDKNISGYWNILRGLLINQYIFNKYIGLYYGVGGSWIYSSFKYDDLVLYLRNNPGVSFEFDVLFSPWKYIRLDFNNQFDLFIENERDNSSLSINDFYPYYKGGIRINFINFIKWFGLYLEVSGLYYHYKKDDVETKAGMVVFDAGMFFDFQFPSLIKNSLKKEIKTVKSGIEALKKAKVNEMVDFPDIVFKKGSNELTKQSIIELLNIGKLLKERKSMEISIRIFSKKEEEDPINLLSSSLEKGEIIRQNLIEQGIDSSRILLPSEVYIFPDKNDPRSLLVRIVVIKE